MTSDNTRLSSLDDRTVLLILSELTQDLRETLPTDQVNSIQSEDEARRALASFFAATGVNSGSVEIATVTLEDKENATVGRKVLTLLLEDSTVHPQVEKYIVRPPEESQMSVELAIAGAVILGALITWVQTKVELEVTHKDGQTEFRFKLDKPSAELELIKMVAKSISSLF